MAGSIKLFQFVQKCHQIIGIHPRQPNQTQRLTNTIQMIFLICCAQFLLSTAAFLVIEAKSMFDYGLSFLVTVALINVIVNYLIFIWQSQNTLEFIENCENFIEKRVQSTVAYKELIKKIELFNKFLCFALYITLVLIFFTILPYTMVRIFISNMEADSFYLFLPSWYPFNWRTPLGYLVAWLAECVGVIPTASVFIQFLNLVFGSGWLFIFIAEDITHDVVAFNSNTKITSTENRAKLTQCFCDMVNIYSDAKQCVKEFNHINKYSLFGFFTWDMFGISVLLVTLQFELWANDSNLYENLLLFFVMMWTMIFTFLLCEPGARMTNQFMIFCDELSRCDWHLLSIEMRRKYLIFFLDTQNPIKMSSYANITCERETTKKVVNKAFSYFMTLRKFDSSHR